MRTFSLPRILAVVLVAALCTTGFVGSMAAGPKEDGRVVIAVFEDVSPIYEGEMVKVRGVQVGQIGTPVLDEQRQVALVPLHLEPSALPVHTDASARVSPVNFLGERYIELDTGSPSAPVLPPNNPIPASQTSRSVNLQSVLNTLDDPTASGLASMLVTLGQGMNGNGKNIQKALEVLAPAMRNTDQLVKVLAGQNELLGNVVDRVEPVTSALAAKQGDKLARLVDSAQKLLAATRARDQELEASVGEAPSTIRAARQTLQDLTGTSRAASSTLAEMRPTIDQLPQISQEIAAFSEAAGPALESANPVLERANKLLEQARPIAEQLRIAGPDIRSTVQDAKPLVTDLNANFGNVLAFIRNWALTTNGRDGLSHYFRAKVVMSPSMISSYFGGLPGQAPKFDNGDRKAQPGPRTDNGEPSGPISEGGTRGAEVLDGIDGGLLEAPSKVDDDNDGATGLTQKQERGALGFLLGGR